VIVHRCCVLRLLELHLLLLLQLLLLWQGAQLLL
jgi:hypothetical protein